MARCEKHNCEMAGEGHLIHCVRCVDEMGKPKKTRKVSKAPRLEFEEIFERSRNEAFAVLEPYLKKALPKGFEIVLPVGWDIIVFNAQGNRFDEEHHSPKLKEAIEVAESFEKLFGFGNERIKRK